MKNTVYFLLFLMIPGWSIAQTTDVPEGNDAYHIMDRIEIKTGALAPFHTAMKPYDRQDITHYTIRQDTTGDFTSKLDNWDFRYVYRDNNDCLEIDSDEVSRYRWSMEKNYTDGDSVFYKPELNVEKSTTSKNAYYQLSKKPVFKYFYKTPANLFELDKENFKLRINPIIHLKFGQESGDSSIIFLNTRGVNVRGNVDDVLWFNTTIYESQARFRQHVTDGIVNATFPTVPGAGFYKDYESSIFNITNGYDYLRGNGYLAARISRHVNIHLGHGRHFIGNGMRSLLLSDYATDYFYLKLNTRVWKIHYQNIFAELTSDHFPGADRTLPNKYMAAHHLSFNNLLPNFSIGFFESVVFDRGNTFELQYLNPIIVYRIVEQAVGSPDNVIAGIHYKYNFLAHFSFYGQLVMDEFVFGEVFGGNGWWANKNGYQLGLKYIDAFGLDHLDLQAEYNTVRPFTYTYQNKTANYTHYNQPLAHPLGANFREAIVKLRYQPMPKLVVSGRVTYTTFGTDTDSTNIGQNIFLDYRTRTSPTNTDADYGHKTGQGVGNQLLIGRATASYQLRHNLYVDLDYEYRSRSSDDLDLEYTRSYIGASIRLNIADRIVDY